MMCWWRNGAQPQKHHPVKASLVTKQPLSLLQYVYNIVPYIQVALNDVLVAKRCTTSKTSPG